MAAENKLIIIEREINKAVIIKDESTRLVLPAKGQVRGPKGDKGDQGDPGPAAIPPYIHTQASPAATWIVQHDLNTRFPIVEIYLGDVISPGIVDDPVATEAEVAFNNLNSHSIIFSSSKTGVAIFRL